jgi:hypothetical protein
MRVLPRHHYGIALRLIAVSALMLVVAACAIGARPEAMTVGPLGDQLPSGASPAYGSIAVGTVGGGAETNPLWKSKIDTADLRKALEESLRLNKLLADEHARYALNADLVSLDQPGIGLDMEVTVVVHYTLVANSDRSTRYDEYLATPYTAGVSDAVIGIERLRLANEGAVRENIKALIAKLVPVLSRTEN